MPLVTGPVCLVYLVGLFCLVDEVHLVYLVQPNKQDKPNKPDNGLLMLADFFRILLEIQQVVGNLFGGEPIDHSHDAAGEVEVGGATIRDENTGVGTLITQSLGL